eukprot:TRINITY_DN1991_c0_g1_i1.p1 TRINITY_DN1991_c0_g1~~TRINITY_DN1991_c0_g1_i1.p1  ORF type:complete len:207 (+),score=56.90 TRINITY_DN1991_c0_g1_i1:69-689(+)
MVLFFTPKDPAYVIYMGKDKFENELLIKFGFPEDVWFHVNDLSSAHVYLRMKKGETIEDIPASVLEDCVQLVKANSIVGCKQPTVNVVYTPWANLKKTGDMDVGQVGFHSQKEVKMVRNIKRNKDILSRLEKTKVERYPDLEEERAVRDAAERSDKKNAAIEQQRREKADKEAKAREEELRTYSSIMSSDNKRSNKDAEDLEEDFM